MHQYVNAWAPGCLRARISMFRMAGFLTGMTSGQRQRRSLRPRR
jgi:hypothetical protein